jgi:hypothetical protein
VNELYITFLLEAVFRDDVSVLSCSVYRMLQTTCYAFVQVRTEHNQHVFLVLFTEG